MKWTKKSLGQISEKIDYGYTASAGNSGVKFLRITDIQNGIVNWETVPQVECSKIEKYALAGGDIVFARTGATTGKSFLIEECPENAVFASYLIRVRPNKAEVFSKYLSYFFDTPNYWGQISSSATGATLPGVNSTKLKELQIPLPPLPTQRRIAAILDKADALRRKGRELLDQYDELVQAVFLEMFGDVGDNSSKWEEKKIHQFVEDILSGTSYGGEERPLTSDELGVLKVSAVTYGEFRPIFKAVKKSEIKKELIHPQKGDILFSRANTRELVAATCIVDEDYPDLFLPDKIWKIKIDQDQVNPYFFKAVLSQDKYRNRLTRKATGTSGSMLNISKAKLRDTLFPIPPIALQRRFAVYIS